MIKLYTALIAWVKATYKRAGEGETPVKEIANSKFYYISVQEALSRLVPYQYNRGRDIPDWNRILTIAKSIATDGYSFLLTPARVVKVNGYLYMLDHHHQVLAMFLANDLYGVKLEIPIQEVAIDDVPFNVAVQLMNNASKGWSLEDYINNYIKEGNGNYIRLAQMGKSLDNGFFTKTKDDEQYPLGRYASALCGHNCQNILRNGTYELSEDDMVSQMEFGREIIDIWKHAGCPKVGSWREAFIVGLSRLYAEYGNKTKELRKAFSQTENRVVFNGTTSCQYWYRELSKLLGL